MLNFKNCVFTFVLHTGDNKEISMNLNTAKMQIMQFDAKQV